MPNISDVYYDATVTVNGNKLEKNINGEFIFTITKDTVVSLNYAKKNNYDICKVIVKNGEIYDYLGNKYGSSRDINCNSALLLSANAPSYNELMFKNWNININGDICKYYYPDSSVYLQYFNCDSDTVITAEPVYTSKYIDVYYNLNAQRESFEKKDLDNLSKVSFDATSVYTIH